MTRIERIRTDFQKIRLFPPNPAFPRYLLNKAGKKPSFSSTCELRGLRNQKLGFLRPEILSRYFPRSIDEEWMMTETMTLTPEICREALKKVIDPEIYQNIVDLGLVYGIAVDDENQVVVDMTLTTPHCPLGPQIIADTERVLTAKGAAAVTVNIVWDPLWTPDAMTEELKRELGIIPDDEEEEEAYEPVIEASPPPPPKKKGFFSRLFGG